MTVWNNHNAFGKPVGAYLAGLLRQLGYRATVRNVSQYSLATLARWCRIRSYLDSATAHGLAALNAIRAALAGKPWLPPLPAVG